MKRFKILLVITCCWLSLIANAQRAFAPIGTEWYYGVTPKVEYPEIEGYYTFKINTDTIISGDTFSRVHTSPTESYLLTQSDSVIYYWYKGNKYVFFKKNVNLNDTFIIDAYFKHYYQLEDTVISLRVTISDISTINDNLYESADLAQNYTLSIVDSVFMNGEKELSPASDPAHFTEKMVWKYDKGLSFLQLFQPIQTTSNKPDYLRCFQSGDYKYKLKTFDKPCDFSNVGLREVYLTEKVTVYPVPASGKIYFECTINNRIQKISVYNPEGKLLIENQYATNSNSESCDIAVLKQGIYYAVIQTEKGVAANKFLTY